ncbi:MAG: nuclear transport factor 2 family protein [Actinomycetota bacterium]
MATTLTVEQLNDLEQIRQLKYRYLRALDQKLWDVLGECLTEDAVAAYSAGKYRHEGREAIVAWISEAMGSEQFLSSHRCHHPEIELTGPDTATGVWALEDVVVIEDVGLTIQGAAFYTDEYRRVDGEWRIAVTGYKRTYEEIFPRASIEGLDLTASWWGTGGASTLDA